MTKNKILKIATVSFINTKYTLTSFGFILLTITPFLIPPIIGNTENMHSNIPIVNNQLIEYNKIDVLIECEKAKFAECNYNKNTDLKMKIVVRNGSHNDISLPFKYLKETGPAIKLTNLDGSGGFYLRPNIADRKLISHLTKVHSGTSVMFDWIIFSSEIERFRKDNNPLKINAKVSITTEVYTKKPDTMNEFIKEINIPIIEKR
ncbi:TPA: hypothetical protein ACN6ZO_002977 [Escherichia albertii]|uniref:Uncharacterized protein n=2 Tax=Escherichia albertii TaxID=208962 RepID=A0ABD7E7D1_ESCAL|nr:hypothetical protein [Escherichia albertii]MCQ8985586.1 hypothetical protein [Escherichia albertii]MCQ9016889.1 hypothetical protein [Escherichia albertii]MCZ7518588.1 hypothetical protein [Escherichia albertii]MCZ8604169.1 hypothetical protein [Escherichia albertii]MCZ8658087.1 hypothetical protein [Escherichia albertii]